jgi:hypothetical protein
MVSWSFPTNHAWVLLRIAHDPGVRLRDVGGVVRATLERSPREQPAHEFPIFDLQVQRHIRGHPHFAAYQVSRAGLVPVPWEAVEDKPAAGRRPAPAAPCRAQPGRARVRPRSRYIWTARLRRSAAPRDRAAVRRSRYGGCRSARQFIPSAAAAVSIGGYRHLLASRATLRHPGTAATPATNSPAATDTPT